MIMAKELVSEEGLKRLCGEFDLEAVLFLDLSDRGLCEFGAIVLCTSLRILNLSSNNFTSVAPLGSLTCLEDLNLSDNQVAKLEGLEKLETLRKLDLPGNCLENLDSVLPLVHLTQLFSLTFQLPGSSLTNPLCSNPSYRSFMTDTFPNLSWLDGENIAGPGTQFYSLYQEEDGRLQKKVEEEDEQLVLKQASESVDDPLKGFSLGDEEAAQKISKLLAECSDTSQKLQEHIAALKEELLDLK